MADIYGDLAAALEAHQDDDDLHGGPGGGGVDAHEELPDTTTSGHPASVITYAGSTNLSATNVEAALDELDAEKSASGHTHSYEPSGTVSTHAASGSHAASNVTSTATGNIAATTVQAAIVELEAEKATIGHVHSGVYEPSGTVNTHISDPVDAHTAGAITNVPAGNVAATTVQAAINELDTEKSIVGHTHAEGDVTAHTSDTDDAHDASAISYAGSTNLSAVNVEAALDELDTEKSGTAHNHTGTYEPINAVSTHAGVASAHTAANVSYAGSTNLSSTNVEAALDELDSEKSATGHNHSGVYDPAGSTSGHTGDTEGAHAATAISYAGSTNLSATTVEAALDELDSEKSASGHTHAGTYEPAGNLTLHIDDTADAHDATAISYAGSTNLSATTVEAALDELDTEKSSASHYHYFSQDSYDPNLRRFQIALADAAASPVRIVVVGDDVAEGHASATREAKWTSVLRDNLRKRFGKFGLGAGYIPVVPGEGSNPAGWVDPWTRTGTISQELYGLGLRNVHIDSSGDSVEIAVQTGKVWIHYTQGPAQGSMEIRINTTLVATVDTFNAVAKSGRTWVSADLTPRGVYTINIRPINTGTNPVYNVLLEGITVFDAAGVTQGITMFEGGHKDYKTSDFAANSAWAGGFDLIDPDLVIIAMGHADRAAAVSTTTFKTNLTTMITTARNSNPAGVEPSIVLVAPPAVGNEGSPVAYSTAVREVAAAQGCAVVDLYEAFGHTDNDPYGIIPNEIHPNDAGHRYIAQSVERIIAPINTPNPTLTQLTDIDANSAAVTGGSLLQHTTFGTYNFIRVHRNHQITLLSGGGTIQWVGMPVATSAAPAEFINTWRRTRVNLEHATKVRLLVNVASVAPAGSFIRVQFSTDLTNWFYLDNVTGPSSDITVTGLRESGWVNLTTGTASPVVPSAKGDVYLRMVGVAATTSSPTFGNIILGVE